MTVNRLILIAILVAPVTYASDLDWQIVEQFESEYKLRVGDYGNYVIPKQRGHYIFSYPKIYMDQRHVNIYDKENGKVVAEFLAGTKEDRYLIIHPPMYDNLREKKLFCTKQYNDNVTPPVEVTCTITKNGDLKRPFAVLDHRYIPLTTTSRTWQTRVIRLTTYNAGNITVRSDQPVILNLKTRKIVINPGAPITLTPPQPDSGKEVISELEFSVSGEITNNNISSYNVTFDTILS